MSSVFYIAKAISPSFVAQEEGEYKLILYVSIPQLRVQSSRMNHSKHIPSNGSHEFIEFKNRSFKFAIKIDDKFYCITFARLPGFIKPKYCSITYENNGCWINLVKQKPISWMNTICDSLRPGLETLESDNSL